MKKRHVMTSPAEWMFRPLVEHYCDHMSFLAKAINDWAAQMVADASDLDRWADDGGATI
ncbi:MAG TPA: hypothetical protein VND94_00900 [Terriglobia bacterium]|nr:hypothetical protein [Terriglobia bacterium]